MSYSIEVAEPVAKRLRAIPSGTEALIVQQIDRLGENPRLGVRIWKGPLQGRMLYAFVVEAGPRVFRLAVLYLFKDDEQTIYLTDIGLLRGDEERTRMSGQWPP